MFKCQNLAVAIYRFGRRRKGASEGWGGEKGGTVTGAFMQKLTITWPGLPRNPAEYDSVIASLKMYA